MSDTKPDRRDTDSVGRFAHPFFTKRHLPPGEHRMTDHIKGKLQPIPPAKGDSTMMLANVIGDEAAGEIESAGVIQFHAVGDTGHEDGAALELVAKAMTGDYTIETPTACPAFFLHLGDVIYYDNTDRGYHAQFYVPYKTYPGKILAIPGNHDGEIFKYNGKPTGQATTLEAFQKNFCQTGSNSVITSGTVLRHMVSQTGVYWRLNAPMVDIVGLYSNMAENPGYIKIPGENGTIQTTWLTQVLKAVKSERESKRKALIIAVHHPPFSDGSHGSSEEMLADIDESCKESGIWPDLVLAAHSHDYQRYTRFLTSSGGNEMAIPYLVIGTGGRGLSPKVGHASGKRNGNLRFDKSLRGYGYSMVKVTSNRIELDFFQVDEHTGAKSKFDTLSVNL